MMNSNTTRPSFPRRPRREDTAIHFGADYNPDQWPETTWAEDIALMQRAGITVVTLPVFSWAHIQPDEDRWDFGWLDRIMDLLAQAGIDVDMATSTASPPAWLTAKHPEVLPTTRTGETLWPGGRQQWRPTSPVFRRYALELTRRMAERYGNHPALVAWHVNNELGCHNAYDYSDDAAAAFRAWLRERYATLEALNDAWGTAFWSQIYHRWEEILPPRLAASEPNPTQLLDFRRFSSDALRNYLRAESEVLRAITPEIPITTNFMVMGDTAAMDYPSWADDVDFVSNDHYLDSRPGGIDELAFSASLTSAIAAGRPWWLMEHSTSAVNWRPVNPPKLPGELARDSLTHLGHGADAICFFQWRASRAGAEKYHAALLPHAGADSRLFRDVVALGRTLTDLSEIAGSQSVRARAAVVIDYESWWSLTQEFLPHTRLDYRGQALDWYRALVSAGLRVDVVTPHNDLAAYDVIVAPLLHVVPTELAERLRTAVVGGSHLVTTYFSGTVDEHDHVILGGYPGALRDLLGIRVEEFSPLLDGDVAVLSNGATGRMWSEEVTVTDPSVQVLRCYEQARGAAAGAPAVTRRAVGEGSATYVSTRLEDEDLAGVVTELLAAAGIEPDLPEPLRGEVIAAVRRGDGVDYWTLTNRGNRDLGSSADVADMLGGTPLGGADKLGVTDAVVVRVPRG
ncbi:beta-galactosidase [Actinomyces sp. MRS3W]|uniref:beta-galactosidase n=1 Tax=Actinomyces sp. MRS3W TaxID=2800796 RepID=UPI0028FD8D0B|nr:beta-galactosidase [Actinomyces sp. MRS3W]MDU0348698.1 beta-galactosidase [Actinomyces sp. MRS3W]